MKRYVLLMPMIIGIYMILFASTCGAAEALVGETTEQIIAKELADAEANGELEAVKQRINEDEKQKRTTRKARKVSSADNRSPEELLTIKIIRLEKELSELEANSTEAEQLSAEINTLKLERGALEKAKAEGVTE